LVSVAAVVRDRKGRFVKDLSQKDFEIVEGGQYRPILDFRAELNGPVKLGLLLDISGSMRVGARTVDAKAAAKHVFAGLRGTDQAAVFTFDTMLSETQAFTSDQDALARALDSAEKPFGQTSLYDAIAQTARMVASASSNGRRGLPQRSAVVVITDGIDTRSRMTPSEVSMVASEIDVPVYILAVVANVDDPRENPEDQRAVVLASDLRELARRTGGDLYISSAPAHASVAAREMVSELRHQYVLAFEASTRAGWRPLEVRTRQGSWIVRARTGYVGGRSS
jgi:VWFA-related protein